MLAKLTIAALLAISATAHAGVIVGGSTLLDGASLSQLENWRGQGALTLINIFTKSRGDTAYNFHFAADGKGPTFSLMKASEDNGITWKTIGGYNPLSWKTYGEAYNASTNPADWTGFVFNLTDSKIWRQNGLVQTLNSPNRGPAFGVGDLRVDVSLAVGVSSGRSYGEGCYGKDGLQGKDCQRSIVDGSAYDGINMLIGALEIFTVTNSPATTIPEPGSLLLISVGLLSLGTILRKKQKSA